MENIKYRIRFSKLGVIRYISHLDMTRVFLRALVRADIPLKFSEGFTPHAKLAFGLPLSVGAEGLNEVCDITLQDGFFISREELIDRLSKQLPSGIILLSCGEQNSKLNDIGASEWRIELPYIPYDKREDLLTALDGDLVYMKKMKKGPPEERNMKGSILKRECFEKNGHTVLELVLPSGNNGSLNPEYVLKALSQHPLFTGMNFEASITRIRLLLLDLKPF